MKVVITGYYGARNCGDELILHALITLFAQHYPGSELTVLSFDPEQTARIHGVAALLRPPFAITAGHLGDWFRVPWLRTIGAVRQADLVVVGGGGLLEDVHNFGSIPQYLQTAALALILGRPVIGLGLGVGPIMTPLSRILVRLIVGHMRRVVVRDHWSSRELQDCGVAQSRILVGADLVFSLARERAQARTKPHGRVRVGLTVGASDWLSFDVEGLLAGLRLFTERTRVEPLVLFATEYNQTSAKILREIESRLSIPCRLDVAERAPEELLSFIAGFDLIVSAKLHGLIGAACSGTPAVCLSYAPKVRSAAQLLGMAQVQSVSHIEPEQLASDMAAALGRDDAHASRTDAAVAELRDRIVATFRAALGDATANRGPDTYGGELLASVAFFVLLPVSLSRQVLRSARGNFRWSASRRRQLNKF